MCLPHQVVRHSLPKSSTMGSNVGEILSATTQGIADHRSDSKMIVESERYTKSIGQVLDDKPHLAVQSVGWSGSMENTTFCLGSNSVSVSNPGSPKPITTAFPKECRVATSCLCLLCSDQCKTNLVTTS